MHVAGLKALVKFAKMLAVWLLLLAPFYGSGVKLLLGVAAVASMHEHCIFSSLVCFLIPLLSAVVICMGTLASPTRILCCII